MNARNARLIAKLTEIANTCNDDEVKAWIGQHLAYSIRDERPRRKRGIEVTLGCINRRVKLDAARVKQLMENGE